MLRSSISVVRPEVAADPTDVTLSSGKTWGTSPKAEGSTLGRFSNPGGILNSGCTSEKEIEGRMTEEDSSTLTKEGSAVENKSSGILTESAPKVKRSVGPPPNKVGVKLSGTPARRWPGGKAFTERN